jgi:hypothetical protein
MAEIQGRLVNLEIDLAGGTTFTKVICQTSGSVTSSAPVTKTQTNCGTKVSVGTAEITISGDFVADTAPGGSEITYEQVMPVHIAGTLVKVRVQSDVTGADFYFVGDGYITKCDLNWATEEACSFSLDIDVTGTPDLVP